MVQLNFREEYRIFRAHGFGRIKSVRKARENVKLSKEVADGMAAMRQANEAAKRKANENGSSN